MANEKETPTGNPDPSQQSAEDAVFGSSESFFEELDNSVNGAVIETPVEPVEATQDYLDSDIAGDLTEPTNPTAEKETRENEGLKKRYSDSSREAQALKAQLDELKPFVPVLNAMKNDSGLVDHVNKRVNGIMNEEKAKNQNMQTQIARSKEEETFKANHKMTDTQFNEMVTDAKTHKLSLEDIHLILNRDKVAGNVANSTRSDMLKQMKNVREMPTSVSGTNSAKAEKSFDDQIFDGLLGSENDLDNLFGDE